MKHRPFQRIALAAVTLLSTFSASHAQQADPAAVQQHVAAATAAAKSDLLGPLTLCRTVTPTPQLHGQL